MLPMDTPTSQAPTEEPPLSLEACLSQLAAGSFAYNQLPAFSDLTRDGVRRINETWAAIPPETRRRLIAEAIELAEENVQYQFGRLCRFALSDSSAEIRQLAISGLWEDETASLLDALLDLATNDPSEDVRAAAIARLGDRLVAIQDGGDHLEYVGPIAEIAQSAAKNHVGSTIIRRRAIEAIGALDQTDETRALIQDAWEHGDQTLEAGALVAMGRTHEQRWLPILRTAISSEDAELRFAAARALGQVGNADDVTVLAEVSLDDDTDVRLAAITALGEIGGPGAVRVLRNLAKDAPETDSIAIEAALDYALLGDDPLRMPT